MAARTVAVPITASMVTFRVTPALAAWDTPSAQPPVSAPTPATANAAVRRNPMAHNNQAAAAKPGTRATAPTKTRADGRVSSPAARSAEARRKADRRVAPVRYQGSHNPAADTADITGGHGPNRVRRGPAPSAFPVTRPVWLQYPPDGPCPSPTSR